MVIKHVSHNPLQFLALRDQTPVTRTLIGLYNITGGGCIPSSCTPARECFSDESGLFWHADMLSIPIGKALMKNRQPMKLKGFAAVHNAFLFGLSLYMCLECIQQVRPYTPSFNILTYAVCIAFFPRSPFLFRWWNWRAHDIRRVVAPCNEFRGSQSMK